MGALGFAVAALAGALIAGLVVWIVAERRLAAARVRLAGLETELRNERATHAEKLALLEGAEQRLRDTFKALSGDTLKASSESFLALANKTFEGLMNQAQSGLDKRKEEITGALKPLQESLKKYEEQVQALESTRQKAFGTIEERLLGLKTAEETLQRETGKLVDALRRPQVRGQWGELALRKVVELAGMTEHCDFDVQVTMAAGEEQQRQRPDMLIRLPEGRSIAVDAKVPLDAYLSALEVEDESARAAALARHARQVRDKIDDLARRGYWKSIEQTPEFTVMFIPESSFVAAVQADRELFSYGFERKVLVASPTTLIALLWSAAQGWRQEELARNAQQISALGRELYERLRTFVEHFEKMRKGLTGAVDAYNAAAGSLQTRVIVAARRFTELGVAPGGEEIANIDPVTESPRRLELRDAGSE